MSRRENIYGSSHEIFGSLASLWGLPVDVLGGSLDVAGFAMNATRTKEKSGVSTNNFVLTWYFWHEMGKEREGRTFAR